MPISPFTSEVFVMRSQTPEGEILETRNRLFDPEQSRKRNLNLLETCLKQRGEWHEDRVGTLKSMIVLTADLSAICHALAADGTFLYDQ